MENKILFTFKVADSDKLSMERIGFIAEEIAANRVEAEELGPHYSLTLADSADLQDGSKEYEFIVFSSSGDSGEEEDQDSVDSDTGSEGLAASP